MDIVGLLITAIIIIAVIAIFLWFVRSSGIAIPQPLVIVFYAVVAIVAIIFLCRFAGVRV